MTYVDDVDDDDDAYIIIIKIMDKGNNSHFNVCYPNKHDYHFILRFKVYELCR